MDHTYYLAILTPLISIVTFWVGFKFGHRKRLEDFALIKREFIDEVSAIKRVLNGVRSDLYCRREKMKIRDEGPASIIEYFEQVDLFVKSLEKNVHKYEDIFEQIKYGKIQGSELLEINTTIQNSRKDYEANRTILRDKFDIIQTATSIQKIS